jgi:hypothetical protein
LPTQIHCPVITASTSVFRFVGCASSSKLSLESGKRSDPDRK